MFTIALITVVVGGLILIIASIVIAIISIIVITVIGCYGQYKIRDNLTGMSKVRAQNKKMVDDMKKQINEQRHWNNNW